MSEPKHFTAIIVAGGTGTRMNAAIPKQFLLLRGKPILMHTLEKFRRANEIILVLPESQTEQWKSLVMQHAFNIPHHIVHGGNTRYLSVKKGLAAVHQEGIVAIHDGVRPLVSTELINRCYEDAIKYGNSIPVISVPESVRSLQEESSTAEDRSRFVLVQTPQCFHTALIKKAYSGEYSPKYTDDASVLESAGIPIHLTEGERWNIKITFKEDMKVADALSDNVGE